MNSVHWATRASVDMIWIINEIWLIIFICDTKMKYIYIYIMISLYQMWNRYAASGKQLTINCTPCSSLCSTYIAGFRGLERCPFIYQANQNMCHESATNEFVDCRRVHTGASTAYHMHLVGMVTCIWTSNCKWHASDTFNCRRPAFQTAFQLSTAFDMHLTCILLSMCIYHAYDVHFYK